MKQKIPKKCESHLTSVNKRLDRKTKAKQVKTPAFLSRKGFQAGMRKLIEDGIFSPPVRSTLKGDLPSYNYDVTMSEAEKSVCNSLLAQGPEGGKVYEMVMFDITASKCSMEGHHGETSSVKEVFEQLMQYGYLRCVLEAKDICDSHFVFSMPMSTEETREDIYQFELEQYNRHLWQAGMASDQISNVKHSRRN